MMTMLLLALAVAGGTWIGGWWMVPLLAAGWGFRSALPAWRAGLAAAAGWAILILTLPWPALGRLAPRLGAMVGAPGWVALGLSPAFALVLGWSGARLGRTLRRVTGARPPGAQAGR